MTKTLTILAIITSLILVTGLLMVMSVESADAKAAKTAFGFGGATSAIIMAGNGDYTQDTGQIRANGIFTLTGSGDSGKWKASTLTTAASCCTTSTSGDNDVVFTAKFKTQTGNEFTWKVVVGTGDINNSGDTNTFWVQGNAFGDATSLFFTN